MKWLREEILFQLEEWENNKNVTKAQQKVYGQEALSTNQLGCDVVDGLRLLTEDGWDGDYVINLPVEQMNLFFQGEPIRINDQAILRMSHFFHIGFYETLVLILKNQWELFLFELHGIEKKDHEMCCAEKFPHDEEYLIEYSNHIEEYLDCNRLFDQMQQYQRFAEKNGFTRTSFINLVHTMVIARLQTVAINGPELKNFTQKQVIELQRLQGEESLQKNYEKAKANWIRLKDTIGRLLVQKEMVKDNNLKIKAEWAEEFGKEWIKVVELESIYEEMNLLINIKEMNQELSFSETSEMVKENIDEKHKQLMKQQSQLKWQMAMNYRVNERQSFSSKVPLEELINCTQKVDELLRTTLANIYLLTHPDRTMHKTFTNQQLNELNEIFQTVNELKETEGPETYILLPLLMQLHKQAEKIWKNMGLSVDNELFMEEGVEDIIEHIQMKIMDLEEEEYQIRNDIYTLSTDQEVCSKKADLQSPRSKSQRHSALKQTRYQLEEKISKAKEEINNLFKGVSYSWN